MLWVLMWGAQPQGLSLQTPEPLADWLQNYFWSGKEKGCPLPARHGGRGWVCWATSPRGLAGRLQAGVLTAETGLRAQWECMGGRGPEPVTHDPSCPSSLESV